MLRQCPSLFGLAEPWRVRTGDRGQLKPPPAIREIHPGTKTATSKAKIWPSNTATRRVNMIDCQPSPPNWCDQAHYTRMFTDERGVSCFEDLAIELQPGFSAPGLEEPILSAPFLASEGLTLLAAASAAASTSEETVMPFYQKGDIRIRCEESSPPGNRPSRKQPEQAGGDEMSEAWVAGSRIGDRAWACVAQRPALIGNAA
jgi:hypothetical protein